MAFEFKIPLIGKFNISRANLAPGMQTLPPTKEVIIKTEEGPLSISGGRNSDPDLPFSLLDILLGEAAIIPTEYQIELIGILEHLGKFNSDVSYAVDNIVQLGNTPYDITFNDSISDKQADLMRRELNKVEKNWYAYSGGLKSLRNDLLAQASITGAVSAEAVPTNNLDGIRKIVLVNPKNIRFAYNGGTDVYEPYQKLSNHMIGMRKDSVNGLVKLNVSTYKYYAVRRFNESPYAIPPFLAALESIAVEKDMLDNFKHVVKKMGVLGFLQVLVKAPLKTQDMDDTAYKAKAQEQLTMAGAEIDKGLKKGYVIGFEGMHNFEMQSTTGNVTGAVDLMKQNTEMKMAGLKQDPLMLGRNYSTSETVGRVILAKLSAQLQNYQMLIDSFLGEVMYLHLILKGYKGLEYVKVESRKPLLADESKEQDAFSKKIDNYDKLYKQGVISQLDRAQALGFDNPDQEEPRAEVIPGTVDTNNPQDATNVNPNPDNGAVEDSTNATDQKLVRLPENAVAALNKQTQLVLHIDLEIKGKSYGRYAVVNGDSVITDGFSTGDIVDFFIADNQIEEALETALEELRADVKPFDYLHGDHCGHAHTAVEGFDRNDRLDKYINKYGKDIKNVFAKSTNKVAGLVTKELSKLSKAATVQQVQDTVLYVLYKNWPNEFNAKNRKYINKWVSESYKSFKSDKSIFPAGATIPKATFNLKDIRTIEYYKKSDSLYLGKFITDEDTKQRITEYIKKKYLDESLPIGGKDVATDFKAEFGETLLKEGYKIDRVITTTVNKMRNTASVAYLNEAEIEKYEIVGITDRLQCAYCKELHGKQFDVVKSVNSTSSLSATSPEEVASETPFATSVFKSAEDMKGLSNSDLQDKGVSLPGFHCGCRCSIKGVL